MYRRANPYMTTAELAKAVLNTYDFDPVGHTLTNKNRGTVIHLRSGGVVSTPFRNITAQVITYIMLYQIHPKDDDPALSADRIRRIKRSLPLAPIKSTLKPKPAKPKQLTLTEKVERLRAAMQQLDAQMQQITQKQQSFEYHIGALYERVNNKVTDADDD